MDIDGDGGRRDLRMKDKRISFDGFRSVGRVPLMEGWSLVGASTAKGPFKATGRLSISSEKGEEGVKSKHLTLAIGSAMRKRWRDLCA
jgi:hypothetical protein